MPSPEVAAEEKREEKKKAGNGKKKRVGSERAICWQSGKGP